MGKVVIVANRTIGGRELEAAVTQRLVAGRKEFHLVVPIPPTPASAVALGLAAAEATPAPILDLPDQRQAAADRLAAGLQWLTSLGATVTGEVGPTDAVTAVCAVVERGGVDEILVSTLPSRLSRWLRQDLPRRIDRHVDVPVSVVTAVGAPPAD